MFHLSDTDGGEKEEVWGKKKKKRKSKVKIERNIA